jgi:hypothetical protein
MTKSVNMLLRVLHSFPLRCAHSRYSPDIVRTAGSVLLCNNNANEVEKYCVESGRLLAVKPTHLTVKDLLHEPRMAGTPQHTCFIEKTCPAVIIKPANENAFSLHIKEQAEPVVLAVHGFLLAVGTMTSNTTCTVNLFCLHSRLVLKTFAVLEAGGTPDDMVFHPAGELLFVSLDETMYVYSLDGQLLHEFAIAKQRTHLALSVARNQQVLVLDMTDKHLRTYNPVNGALMQTAHTHARHPIAVSAFEDVVHILDAGRARLFTYVLE